MAKLVTTSQISICPTFKPRGKKEKKKKKELETFLKAFKLYVEAEE